MGLFEKLFGKKEQPAALKAQHMFQLLDGYVPAFHNWNGSVFESDLIRAALDAHGRHAAKLQVNVQGSAKPALAAKLKIQPNDFQTWSQFLYRTAVILYAKTTAFIVPVRNEDKYKEIVGIAGIVPERWELVEYNDVPYIRFTLANNRRAAVKLSECGILTRYQYRSDLFGEGNEAMKSTLDLIEMQRQGIVEGVKNSATYRFMGQSDNWATDEDLAAEMERFNRNTFQNLKTSGGFLLFPNTFTNISQIKQDSFKVDADQLALIKNNVFDYFAINEDVIQSKSFGDAWLAFYESCVEWLAIQLSDVVTRMLFSERERQFGNRVFFTSNRLQYMSNADKMNAISQMADRGLMTRNELREILNLAPLPEPWGNQIPARGEYYDITNPPAEKKPEEDPAEKPAEDENGGDDNDGQ